MTCRWDDEDSTRSGGLGIDGTLTDDTKNDEGACHIGKYDGLLPAELPHTHDRMGYRSVVPLVLVTDSQQVLGDGTAADVSTDVVVVEAEGLTH